MFGLNEVFFPGRATDPKTLAILRAAWRDLAAHWRQLKRAASSLWPLWLGFAVLAFALLASVSLAFDATEARAAAQLDPRLVGFFEIVTQAGKSNWLFALSILTLAYALYRHALEQNRRLRARSACWRRRPCIFSRSSPFPASCRRWSNIWSGGRGPN